MALAPAGAVHCGADGLERPVGLYPGAQGFAAEGCLEEQARANQPLEQPVVILGLAASALVERLYPGAEGVAAEGCLEEQARANQPLQGPSIALPCDSLLGVCP